MRRAKEVALRDAPKAHVTRGGIHLQDGVAQVPAGEVRPDRLCTGSLLCVFKGDGFTFATLEEALARAARRMKGWYENKARAPWDQALGGTPGGATSSTEGLGGGS